MKSKYDLPDTLKLLALLLENDPTITDLEKHSMWPKHLKAVNVIREAAENIEEAIDDANERRFYDRD